MVEMLEILDQFKLTFLFSHEFSFSLEPPLSAG